jgi:PAS domain-containing protein
MKQQQKALQQARDAREQEGEQLRAILNHLPDGVTLAAKNGELVLMNAACRELNFPPIVGAGDILTMRDAMALLLRFAEEPMDPETIESHLDHRMAVFLESGISRRETRRFGRYLDIRWVPLPDGRRLILHRDVTELKQQEQAVVEARKLMETVLNNMTDGVMLYDRDAVCVYANKSFFRIQESTPERIARLKTFPKMMDSLFERGAIDAPFREAALARFARADGTPKLRQSFDGRWSEGGFHRLDDGGILGIFRDVTDRRHRLHKYRERTSGSPRQRRASA